MCGCVLALVCGCAVPDREGEYLLSISSDVEVNVQELVPTSYVPRPCSCTRFRPLSPLSSLSPLSLSSLPLSLSLPPSLFLPPSLSPARSLSPHTHAHNGQRLITFLLATAGQVQDDRGVVVEGQDRPRLPPAGGLEAEPGVRHQLPRGRHRVVRRAVAAPGHTVAHLRCAVRVVPAVVPRESPRA